MHELYATQAILEKAIEKAGEEKRKAHHECLSGGGGDFHLQSTNSVQFYWDEICKGTIARSRSLHFRHVPAELQCMACFTKYDPKEGEIVCPNCGSTGARDLERRRILHGSPGRGMT